MNTPSTIAFRFSYCSESSMSLIYVTVAPPINNTVRAPAVRLRPSNSASPQLHGATLDSLVIRNPPGNKSVLLPTCGRRAVERLLKHGRDPGGQLPRLVGGIKSGFRWRYVFLSGSLTHSAEDYFSLCFGWGKVCGPWSATENPHDSPVHGGLCRWRRLRFVDITWILKEP